MGGSEDVPAVVAPYAVTGRRRGASTANISMWRAGGARPTRALASHDSINANIAATNISHMPVIRSSSASFAAANSTTRNSMSSTGSGKEAVSRDSKPNKSHAGSTALHSVGKQNSCLLEPLIDDFEVDLEPDHSSTNLALSLPAPSVLEYGIGIHHHGSGSDSGLVWGSDGGVAAAPSIAEELTDEELDALLADRDAEILRLKQALLHRPVSIP